MLSEETLAVWKADDPTPQVDRLIAEIERLQAQKAKMIKILKYYGNPRRFEVPIKIDGYKWYDSDIWQDTGKRAYNLIQEIEAEDNAH